MTTPQIPANDFTRRVFLRTIRAEVQTWSADNIRVDASDDGAQNGTFALVIWHDNPTPFSPVPLDHPAATLGRVWLAEGRGDVPTVWWQLDGQPSREPLNVRTDLNG